MKLAGAYISEEKYERLVSESQKNNRTLAGQCRHLFDKFLREQDEAASGAQSSIKSRISGVMKKNACKSGRASK